MVKAWGTCVQSLAIVAIRPRDREGVRFGQGFTKHAICQKCRP
jgi:hypothetical protein